MLGIIVTVVSPDALMAASHQLGLRKLVHFVELEKERDSSCASDMLSRVAMEAVVVVVVVAPLRVLAPLPAKC